LLLCSPSAFGAFIPLTGDPVPLSSLEDEGLVVRDKWFYEFDLFAFATGGALAPDPDTIFLQGGEDDVTRDIGLRFLMSLNAGTDQLINANLSFAVAVLPNTNLLIEDASLLLTGASATGDGIVSISETILDGPVPGGAVLASLSASKQSQDGGAALTDHIYFQPVPTIWVRKDISVSGGASLASSAHASEFFQFYSQVPEPATMALLAVGGVMLATRRRP